MKYSMKSKKPKTDLLVRNHGSIFLVTPVTKMASQWISENVSQDSMWWAGSLVVEHRYVEDLLQGASSDGLVVKGDVIYS